METWGWWVVGSFSKRNDPFRDVSLKGQNKVPGKSGEGGTSVYSFCYVTINSMSTMDQTLF